MKLMKIVQKQSGISRRKARDLVEEGEVSVNGQEERNPFEDYELDDLDSLYLRGHPLSTNPPKKNAYRYYKPQGVLCSHDDPHYGRTLGRLLRAEGFIGYRWAGRLDQDAEGLVLLSNDGQLVHALTHPRYEVEKKYHIWVSENLSHGRIGEIIQELMGGVREGGDLLQIERGGAVERGSEHSKLELVLTEGKKNEIKRICEVVGLNLIRLRRVELGPIKLDGLSPGDIERIGPARWSKLCKYRDRALSAGDSEPSS